MHAAVKELCSVSVFACVSLRLTLAEAQQVFGSHAPALAE